jgi:hypothetical protein
MNTIHVRLIDLYTMLEHVMRGATNPNVGFEDAERTLEQLRAALNREVAIDKDVVESALWSCSLMDEQQLFEHPEALTFDTFVSRVTPRGYRFTRLYHLFLPENK